jgi:hypothetical protein
MQHIKLFEAFSMGLQEGKTMIEISIDGENPDAKYGCTAVGVGNSPREAAMFAIRVVCDWLQNSDDMVKIQNLDDFYDSVVTDFFPDENELKEVIEMIERGEIEKSVWGYSPFSGHGDAVYADVEKSLASPADQIGGYIEDSYLDQE